MMPRKIRFTVDETNEAANQWGFNCGPGALCAILDMTPSEIRPHLQDFESKGYLSPGMMASILRGMQMGFRSVFEEKADCQRNSLRVPIFPQFGLVRIQWDGRWCDAGVPVPVRYRKTHWIAYERTQSSEFVFDVNGVCVGEWIPFIEWADELIPWLIRESVKGGTGKWWPTHCWNMFGTPAWKGGV